LKKIVILGNYIPPVYGEVIQDIHTSPYHRWRYTPSACGSHFFRLVSLRITILPIKFTTLRRFL
jgi:hypothetical protein